MAEVIFDLETQHLSGQQGATWKDPSTMKLAVGIVLDRRTNRHEIYGPGEVEELCRRLAVAERIVGWNLLDFDYRVIGLDPEVMKPKTLDLLCECRIALGKDPHKVQNGLGLNLNNICRHTLREVKGGTGKEAPGLFQEGKWGALISYCQADVDMTLKILQQVEVGDPLSNGKKAFYLDKERIVMPEKTPG